jgi:hypothetical protein
MESVTLDQPTASAAPASLSEDRIVNGPPRDSAALRRLMEEVRLDEANGLSTVGTYDRAHNRHNR